MEFGIFSNGFRPHGIAADSYNEDIREIVLAEELGFRDAYISEHHGELPYVNRVDTIPEPDLLICKASAFTSKIRMGSAVKLIHIHHPIDVGIQAAVTSHMLGPGRYIFGFGTGFASPLFSQERGLTFEDRHARLAESLEAIIKCWNTDEPFDLDGKYWNGKGLIALPKPRDAGGPAMATATDNEPMLKLAAERGYALLTTFQETAARVRAKAERYVNYALAAGQRDPLKNIVVSRIVYIADTRQKAIEDLRAAVAYEVSVQAERGFLKLLKNVYNLDVPNDGRAIDVLVDAGIYLVGDAQQVTKQLKDFYIASGGFGTLLIVAGKAWANTEKRHASMRAFMSDVAPQLREFESIIADEPPRGSAQLRRIGG
jgi:alkanesulfonate monooxygenase SsuD/methylene tetrahydromethanopterin reductase-like flavin-dependent oxidoreductase (luciferase family)